ncbi:MAG: hypothetical protein ABI623_12655, partial [bacterium]
MELPYSLRHALVLSILFDVCSIATAQQDTTAAIENQVRLRLAEEDDSVGIRAFEIIVHAPAVGGFGELLVVDDDEG